MFQLSIPFHDIPPPFKEEEVNKQFDLLQNTAYCRDGSKRIPTPERSAVLQLAAGVDKHRLRRQQQLLLDIAQRCKEQEISDLSDSITTRCSLTAFNDKYIRDMKNYSTNTILFKTWHTPKSEPGFYDPLGHEKETKIATFSTPRPPDLDRANTFFPARTIRKLPPKDMSLKPVPTPQVGYSKGLQGKIPSADQRSRETLKGRKVNGPIQLDGFRKDKYDYLQPLILPSIRYVGIDTDNVDAYVKAKKIPTPRSRSVNKTNTIHGSLKQSKRASYTALKEIAYETQSMPAMKQSVVTMPDNVALAETARSGDETNTREDIANMSGRKSIEAPPPEIISQEMQNSDNDEMIVEHEERTGSESGDN